MTDYLDYYQTKQMLFCSKNVENFHPLAPNSLNENKREIPLWNQFLLKTNNTSEMKNTM